MSASPPSTPRRPAFPSRSSWRFLDRNSRQSTPQTPGTPTTETLPVYLAERSPSQLPTDAHSGMIIRPLPAGVTIETEELDGPMTPLSPREEDPMTRTVGVKEVEEGRMAKEPRERSRMAYEMEVEEVHGASCRKKRGSLQSLCGCFGGKG